MHGLRRKRAPRVAMWEPSPGLYKARLDGKWNKERGDRRGWPNPTNLPTCQKQSVFNRVSHQQVKACGAGSSPGRQQNLVVPFHSVLGVMTTLHCFYIKKILPLCFLYCLGDINSLCISNKIWHPLLFRHWLFIFLYFGTFSNFLWCSVICLRKLFYLLLPNHCLCLPVLFWNSGFSLWHLHNHTSLPKQVSRKGTEGTCQIHFFFDILLFTPAICRLLNCLSQSICAKILSQSLNNLKLRLVVAKVFAKEREPWLQEYLAGLLHLKEELKRERSRDMSWAREYICFIETINNVDF